MTDLRSGLMLYHGSNHVTEEELRAVPTPEGTRTHRPIPHAMLLDLVRESLDSRTNYRVTDSAFGVDHTGEKFFGLLQVANGDLEGQDHAKVIGIRNSHGKQFAAAVFCGGKVWVCENLEIGAEHILNHKHTVHILDRLPDIVAGAVGKVKGMFHDIAGRYDRLKATPMNDSQAHDFLCNGLRDWGTVSARSLPKVLQEWHEPTHEDFKPRTAWSLFNAHTEAFKDGKTRLFNGFTDQTLKMHNQFESWMAKAEDAILIPSTNPDFASVC